MYQDLKSYQNAVIIHDFTVEFAKRYVDRIDTTYTSYKSYSRQADQMIQAARSGCQNIVEAVAELVTRKQDYEDYLRQHSLQKWAKDDMRAMSVRQLAYTTHKTYTTYGSYMKTGEGACNAMLCLINQTTYLLDQQIKAVQAQFIKEGDHDEQLRGQRNEFKKKQIIGAFWRKFG